MKTLLKTFCLLIFCQLTLAESSLHFNSITQSNGLSNNSVFSILQDKQGFMWFATDDGLNRYDGKDFIIYRHNVNDPNSISSNRIYGLAEDREGNLWIATQRGLNHFNTQTGKFKRFFETSNSITGKVINSIAIDKMGQIWLGTTRTGVAVLTPETRELKHFIHEPTRTSSLSSDHVSRVFVDSLGEVWITTYKGLNRFNPETNDFTVFYSENNSSLVANDISNIIQDENDQLWLSASGRGLSQYDRASQKFTHYPFDSDLMPKEALMQHPWRLLNDRQYIWIGTFGGGLLRFNKNSKNYQHFDYDAVDELSIASSFILSLYKDRTGMLWIGAENVGLHTFNPTTEVFKYFKFRLPDEHSAEASSIQSVLEDSQGNLWVGTNELGLYRLEPISGNRIFYNQSHDSKYKILERAILDIEQDKYENIWLAVQGQGLVRFTPSSGELKTIKKSDDLDEVISSTNVQKIEIGPNGDIWALGDDGIFRFSPELILVEEFSKDLWEKSLTDNVHQFVFDHNGKLLLLSSNNVFELDYVNRKVYAFPKMDDIPDLYNKSELQSLYRDENNTIWVGSRSGIFQINEKNKLFNYVDFTSWKNIKSKVVSNITHDNNNDIWFTTNNELVKYYPSTKEHVSFSSKDGLLNFGSNSHNKLLAGVLSRTKNGKLVVSGKNGLYLFDPNQIQIDSTPPQVAITELHISDTKVPIGKFELNGDNYHILSKDIRFSQSIQLSHQTPVFSFLFTALHFASPQSNQLAYQLVGFDDGWRITTSDKNSATYTNLSQGSYVFRVKAANKYGVWSSEITRLSVEILPPPWKTWWAFVIYAALFFSFVIYLINYQRNRLMLAKQMAFNEELIKFDKIKDDFLAHTTHELRSPLQGMIGIGEVLLQESGEENTKEKLNIIVTSGKRLNSLINDILDYSKIESGILKIHKRPVSLKVIVDSALQILSPLVESDRVNIINTIADRTPKVEGDENRLLQIFLNLISNGIKYTDYGEIVISCEIVDENARVTIADTGIGIDEDQIQNIFVPFRQLESEDGREFGGTGIGLPITKQLVELHGGSIQVSSQKKIGSKFRFTIPLSVSDHSTDVSDSLNKKMKGANKSTILVVDDDLINLKVVRAILRKDYLVIEASSGKSAVECLETHNNINLVLLDFNMPGLSGIETCEIIRREYSSSKLPIFFLTGSSVQEDIEKCMNAGANEYLEKPVSRATLLELASKYLK